MPFAGLREQQRRRRQAETLAKMLADVEAMLADAEKIQGERELTGVELVEVDALKVRRQRIADSISEAGAAGPGA